MSVNTGTAGFLRTPIVDKDSTISRDFLKFIQNLQTYTSQYRTYTVAQLPTNTDGTLVNGSFAFATNGRKVGEGAGAGTGVPVYYSGGVWRVYSTDGPVAA
jgi:hypothetical protein